MSISGYQDIAAAAMGGYAGSVAPTYQQSATNVAQQGVWNEYGRQQLGRNKRRADKTFDLGEERAYRAFPGQYNKRGMLDSGQYQRGGRELAKALMRQRQMSAEDYQQAIMTSQLEDALATGNLEGLRAQLTSQQYHNLVNSIISESGGVA